MSQPTPRSASHSRQIALIIGTLCAAVAIPALLILNSLAGKKASSWYGQYDAESHPAYDFSLIDQDGKPFHLRDLRGRVVLMSFGFTRCPNICPTTLGDFAAVYRSLSPEEQERTRIVFVSVDERDTPESLKEYVPFFHKNFIGLTGPAADIGTVARAYGAFFRKAPAVGSDKADYMIDHSTYAYLIDPDGNLKILYRFEQLPETNKIADDVKQVLSASAHRKNP